VQGKNQYLNIIFHTQSTWHIAKQQSNIPLMHQFFIINKNGFSPSTIFLPLHKTPQNAGLTSADEIGKLIFLM
jgi:hypothetical protein